MALVLKNVPANVGGIRDVEFDPWVKKIPWKRKWQLTPVFLPGKSHGWWATIYGVSKSQTPLSDFTSTSLSLGEKNKPNLGFPVLLAKLHLHTISH